jgi:mannose-6-phosphate isomerase-like protein (cupin superfamily)
VRPNRPAPDTLSPIEITNRARVQSFTTLDGSTIREFAHPKWTAARHQSLAEATIGAGMQTVEHLHHESEEIYYFVAGGGRMRLGTDEREVLAGDCVVIPPGTPHKLWAAPDADLVLLCACAPAYSDSDTELLEQPASR